MLQNGYKFENLILNQNFVNIYTIPCILIYIALSMLYVNNKTLAIKFIFIMLGSKIICWAQLSFFKTRFLSDIFINSK